MQNPDVKNSKYGYAHELVGSEVHIPVNGVLTPGKIIRVQEPVGTDTQTNIVIEDAASLNGERYCPIEEVAFLEE